MTVQKKKVVYLQRSSNHAADITARNVQRFGLLFCPERRIYTTAVCKPRKASIMDVLAAACWLEQNGKWHTAFIVPQFAQILHAMNKSKKTAGETANPITFTAEWIDFTQHLTNAQFGRLARCVARFERGDINREHVAELNKDAAVGVAYNFITDQISRRARS